MSADPQALADRVFASILAPLVLGGTMRPSRPIGARAALALAAAGLRPRDADLASRADLARVALARKLAPIDRVRELGLASGADWALGAALHDLLQVASPAWVRRSPPKRVLDLVSLTLDRVAPALTAREALERHTWFAQLFVVHRTDTKVAWWTGTRDFLGEPPPARLLVWPDLRRVHVARAHRGVMDLMTYGGIPELQVGFAETLTRFLRATPLTDLATLARGAPEFAWGPATIALLRAPIARTLALRAVAQLPQDAADAALGRATRALLTSRAWAPATVALDFLGHRALSAAQSSTGWGGAEGGDAAAFARAAGAMLARKWLDDPAAALPDAERRRLAPILDGVARGSAAASELTKLLAAS